MRLSKTRATLPRAFVAEHQRRRVVDAMAVLAHDWGIEEVTVSMLCKQAHMSRATFYGHFDGSKEFREYAVGDAFTRIFDGVRQPGETWTERLRSGLTSLFHAVAEDPLMAELALVHSSFVGNEESGYGREGAVARIGGMFEDPPSSRPARRPLLEEYVSRMIVALLIRRILQERTHELPEEVDDLVLIARRYFETGSPASPSSSPRR